MKILISGASGLVGSALVDSLRRDGRDVRALSRGKGEGIFWNPETGEVDQSALRAWGGPDAVVHLAGENIARRRWSAEQKRRIRDSRVNATEKLCRSLQTPVFICASAVGYYGNRGGQTLTESEPPGSDFLARVCVDWERAAQCCANSGGRVVQLRFGLILARHGGALAKMLPIFRAGLGGRLGRGTQWVSWISLRDVVRAIQFALENRELTGAFNTVAPNPVTNSEFTRALAGALRRPAFLPVPAFALRLVFGEMADATLLTSQRAISRRLMDHGFQFSHPEIAAALKQILGAPG